MIEPSVLNMVLVIGGVVAAGLSLGFFITSGIPALIRIFYLGTIASLSKEGAYKVVTYSRGPVLHSAGSVDWFYKSTGKDARVDVRLVVHDDVKSFERRKELNK